MSDTILLRPAHFDDVEGMVNVMNRALDAWQGGPHEDPTKLIEAELTESGVWSQLAIIDVRVVGFVLGCPDSSMIDEPNETLSLLMVAPEYWRRGVASALLTWATQACRDRNARCIELWVPAGNLPACALYEKHGYVAVAVEYSDVTASDSVVYRLAL